MGKTKKRRKLRGGAVFVMFLVVTAMALGVTFAVRPDIFAMPFFGGQAESPMTASGSGNAPTIGVPRPTTGTNVGDDDADENGDDAAYEYTPQFIFEYITEVDNDLLPWNLTLVNRYNFLYIYFHPTLASVGGGHYLDYRVADSLVAMLESAREEGLRPIVASSFRSVYRQRYLFDRQVTRNLNAGMDADEAFEQARRVVAYPGSSEHNLGLGVDIVAYHYRNLTANFGQTPEGQWLAQNAHNYGFILRYPYEKQHITNIIYEPWHFRYVGVEYATRMFEQGLVLEEYVAAWLWERER